MKKNYRGKRKWIKGLDKTVKHFYGITYPSRPNGYSKSIQFPNVKKLRDGRHKYFIKNGILKKRKK